MRSLYPYQSKATTPFDHPSALYITPSPYPYALKPSAGGTYTDQYIYRLADTYLLRAEAYLGLNMPNEAAADINVVRVRSNASEITGADVDIDFILDERMREFGVEEKRMLTLMRLGKLYDRIIKCNPFYAVGIQPHHNLWPIPQAQIERNRGAVLEQNPGYN
jgi:starch-binding outer membrane protein, SusD/RagB family